MASRRVWTLYVENLSEQIHWQGLWQVFDRHGRVLDSFIPQKRALDGCRFGFVRMGSEEEVMRRKRGASNPGVSGSKAYVENGMLASRVDVEDGPPVEPRVTRCVEGLEMGDHLLILQRCSIGWCRSPISNSNLVEEMCLEKIRGVHVMRISGLRVLLIFDSFEFRQQVVSSEVLDMWFSREDIILDCRRVWVSVFGEATLEPSSFERGRVLIETTVIDRIEERLEFSVGGRVFSVCISESDTLLHGPRVCRMRDNSSNSGESVSIGDEERIDREDVRGQDGATDALVPAVRDHEQLVDEAVNCVGPVVEGSNTEVLVSNGHKRKVRLLTDIISSLQTPEEKRKAAKAVQRRGHGRPCKSAISTSEIADISLNDSDLLYRKKAILKEVAEMVEFGKLLDAKTIGCEAMIVQDIARILAHSQ
ncbi:hypothetical protein V6N13_101245 [Hibiscus sabdariffa]